MKKVLFIIGILITATILLGGCTQKHNPFKPEPVPPAHADTIFFAKAWVNPDSGQVPLTSELQAYGAYMIVSGDPSVHLDTTILLTGQFAYLWQFYPSGEYISDSSGFFYTFKDTGVFIITCTVTDLKTGDSITQFLKVKVTGTSVEPPDTSWHYNKCHTINSSQKEVYDVLVNPPGKYKVDITVTTEKIKPEQTVSVQIGDKFYRVKLENLTTTLSNTLQLSEGAVVIILTTPPHAYGHDITICITITRLDST